MDLYLSVPCCNFIMLILGFIVIRKWPRIRVIWFLQVCKQPTPVLLPGESYGRRSLVGYSPRGHKESDMTERLNWLTEESACNAGDLGTIPDWEDPLEKGKAAHSNILAWRIPWTVYSMGSQRVRHDWVTLILLYILQSYSYLCPHFSVSCICLKPCMVLSHHLLLKGPPLTYSTTRTYFRVSNTPCPLPIPRPFRFLLGFSLCLKCSFPSLSD